MVSTATTICRATALRSVATASAVGTATSDLGPRGVGRTITGERLDGGGSDRTGALGRVCPPFTTPRASGTGGTRPEAIRISLGGIAIIGIARGPGSAVVRGAGAVGDGPLTGTGKGRKRPASRRLGLGPTPTVAPVAAVGAVAHPTAPIGRAATSVGGT